MITFSKAWDSSTTTYKDTKYRIILGIEERGIPKLDVYIDKKGYATIGTGFLVGAQAESILKTLFARLTPTGAGPTGAQITTVANAVGGSSGDKKFASAADAQTALNTALQTVLNDSTKTFKFANNDEVTSTFYLIDQQFEKQINRTLSDVPEGRERVALLSLAYNGLLTTTVSPTLIKDITTDNNRADAWYQIRYNSNGGDSKGVGIAKRRFYESSLFGLSADLNAPTQQEAQQAYKMLNAHRTDIFEYEKLWGELPSGAHALNEDGSHRTALQALAQDYAGLLNDANLSASRNATLDNQLDPIKNVLLNNLRTQLSASEKAFLPANASVKATALYVADGDSGATLDAGAFWQYFKDGTSNDVLVGAAGMDNLKGGRGDDVLIGLAGDDTLDGGDDRDTMIGGNGFDTYIAGDGDTILDIDGKGKVTLDGLALKGGNKLTGDSLLLGLGTDKQWLGVNRVLRTLWK